jgi:lipid-binding SYLF domain-containing protein
MITLILAALGLTAITVIMHWPGTAWASRGSRSAPATSAAGSPPSTSSTSSRASPGQRHPAPVEPVHILHCLAGDSSMNFRSFASAAILLAATVAFAPSVAAATAAELRRDAQAALNSLYAKNPGAKALGKDAVAILVFPGIVKAGLGVGGQYGEGVLFRNGKATAYYNTAGASYGLQVGAQKYGYALFFLSEDTLKYIDRSEGFEVGVGPSVVIADEGFAKSMTTTTVKDKIYAFIFDQKGAMAGLGIQGNKITKIKK